MDKIVYGIIIAFLFIGSMLFVCVILIRLYFIKIKKYTKLLYQKDIDLQKAVTVMAIETQEQVLNNISQDLHDDAGQQLTSINFQLENLKLDSPELEKVLAPISKSVGQLSQSIRSISHSLNHQVLLQEDFIKAMATEVKRLKKNKKLSIEFNFDEIAPKRFSDNERIFIYRIFQECINNCLKHSKASVISIKIQTKPEFEMVFSDNGIGFDAGANSAKASMGISNMKTRARDINYLLSIDSGKNAGTTITLSETKRN